MIVTFIRMPLADKAALLAAWLLLGWAAIVLRLFAFRRVAPLIGMQAGPVAFVPLLDVRQDARARLVKRAIRRAARIAPLRSDCLPQLLAGAVLCRLMGVPTSGFLGVKLGEEPRMAAHAWLCAGRVQVTGGPSFGEYTVTCSFARPGPAASGFTAMPERHRA